MSNHDEVFGLPFLFTGGLPNSLEKFTEGNLKCFLIYLIEVVGKANRQNVWQKPAWWKSKLIPYSPIKVDTAQVPQEQVVNELRSLVESCYQYYKAEKILEVSRQLAEIPRILLGIRDNFDNTMTVFDTNSKAVYVTVRPENLYYDTKSLNKVSKDWKSNYTKEDGTFCKIDKAEEENHKIHNATFDGMVIELSDSDTDDEKKQKVNKWSSRGYKMITMPTPRRCSLPPNFRAANKNSQGVVVKSGNDVVIALSDSEDEQKVSPEESLSNHKPCPEGQKSDDEDVEFVSEYINSRPCPKSFKKHPIVNKGVNQSNFVVNPNIIVVSDSEGDASPEDTGVCISSYTSLAKNFQHQYYVETPNKNAQKSILGPLMYSPRKTPPVVRSPRVVLSPIRWSTSPNKSPRSSATINTAKKAIRGVGVPAAPSNRSKNLQNSSDDEDILKPTKEEIYLRKKKKRLFYSTPASIEVPEPPLQVNTQNEFMALLGMKNVKTPCNDLVEKENKEAGLKVSTDLEQIIRSMRTSLHRMPLDWLQVLSSKCFLFAKRNYRPIRNFESTSINYEPFCSTDKSFVEYSIKTANSSVGKEGRSNNRQGRRGIDKNAWTLERWHMQNEEGSQRAKRASLRMLRSLCSGDNAMSSKDSLLLGTLSPTIMRLPNPVFEKALHSTVNLKDSF